MLTLAKLFGRSPFAPLQNHMNKVASCIAELAPLFEALVTQDLVAIAPIVEKISRLEYEADLTKNDIRNHLPRSLFLPVDRAALLEILGLQDAIADQAEKIGYLTSMRPLQNFQNNGDLFIVFCSKNIEVFWQVHQVIQELENLIESSFGGIEAEKVKGMVDQIAFYQYETDKMKHLLMKQLYQEADEMSYASFHLSLTLIEEIGSLATFSENLANRVRMLLELK